MFKQRDVILQPIYISLSQLWNHGPRSLKSQKRQTVQGNSSSPKVWIATAYNGHVVQPGSSFKYLKVDKRNMDFSLSFSVSYFLSCVSGQQYYPQLAKLFWRQWTVTKFSIQRKSLKNNQMEMDNFACSTSHSTWYWMQTGSHNLFGTCAKLVNVQSIQDRSLCERKNKQHVATSCFVTHSHLDNLILAIFNLRVWLHNLQVPATDPLDTVL